MKLPQGNWENAVLLTKEQWQSALQEVIALGLQPHPDPPKNWDSLAALTTILRRTDPNARILDAGAEGYSVILPWLAHYGYQELRGLNLSYEQIGDRPPIVYELGDLTQTQYPSQSFDAITCLSVIEHGVNLEAYFQEMSRLLKPGGVLITSTDYYESAIATQGKVAFGTPVRIFQRRDLEQMLDLARRCGLQLTSPLPLECQEKTISWLELDYTFAIFTALKIPINLFFAQKLLSRRVLSIDREFKHNL
ncbi:MAG: class I SAM-dependent methyltransferase [Chloroflexaceae bacterium]|nr:class I SAM-dependent methyltransferase [Chloroflexaceae bacterium]